MFNFQVSFLQRVILIFHVRVSGARRTKQWCLGTFQKVIFFRNFEVRHPRCVSNKSNYKVYAYIFKHNYVLGGMLFTIRKAQLHVPAIFYP